LNAQISQKNTEINTLQNTNNNLQREATAKTQELATVNQTLATAEGNKQELLNQKESLKNDIKQLLYMIDQNDNTIAGLEETEATLTAQMITHQRQLQDSIATIQTLQTDIVSLRDRINFKIEQINELTQTISLLRQLGEQMAREFEALQQALTQDITAMTDRFQRASQELDVLTKQYNDLYTSCPKIPHHTVVGDKSTGVLFLVEQTNEGSTLHPFPNMDVYKSHGSPTYTLYESYQLARCAKGDPVTALASIPPPKMPSYKPPPHLHPPARAVFISASMWMTKREIRVLSLSDTTPRPRVISTLDNTSVFTCDPETGKIQNQAGTELKLKSTSQQVETGWNFVPYTARPLGKLAFQLEMYSKKLSVVAGLNVTTLANASSFDLETVWFAIGV
jgi:predicted  nucleic acid-binding Zn-ribbon protein